MPLKVRKGGNFRLVLTEVKNNDTFTVPAGYKIEVVAKKKGTTASNLSLGTSQGGSQIATAQALGTTDGAYVPITLAKSFFESKTTVYITLSQANTCDPLTVLMTKVSL